MTETNDPVVARGHPGEPAAVLAANRPADRCLYTGPGKTAAEVAHALRCGVRLFSVESEADLDRLAAAATATGAEAQYLIRLNLGGSASSGLRMTGRPSQFRIDATAPAAMAALLKRRGRVRPVGVHVFTVTNVPDEAGLVAEFSQTARAVAAWWDQARFEPELVGLGGGFAAPYAMPGTKLAVRRLHLCEAQAREDTDFSRADWPNGI